MTLTITLKTLKEPAKSTDENCTELLSSLRRGGASDFDILTLSNKRLRLVILPSTVLDRKFIPLLPDKIIK